MKTYTVLSGGIVLGETTAASEAEAIANVRAAANVRAMLKYESFLDVARAMKGFKNAVAVAS